MIGSGESRQTQINKFTGNVGATIYTYELNISKEASEIPGNR